MMGHEKEQTTQNYYKIGIGEVNEEQRELTSICWKYRIYFIKK